jgi:hypothetical protein
MARTPKPITARSSPGTPKPTTLERIHELASVPIATFYLLNNDRLHPSYNMTWWKRLKLGYRMYRNTSRIPTATNFKAHLAMAMMLLETPPDEPGVVVECGSYRGGSTANLSLICKIVGRELIVYDSFEGLPAAEENDAYANPMAAGSFKGSLEEVTDNVRRFGEIECCTFRKGWFSDTLPQHREPIVLAFLDVDFQASMHQCVLHLWPHLTPTGMLFMDEYLRLDKCALFFSEKYWRAYFDRKPPGLVGSGSGVQLGEFFMLPWGATWRKLHRPNSTSYTRKNFTASWDYYPDDETTRSAER